MQNKGVVVKKNVIDFYASELQYFDHMQPIWEKLPDEYKGIFFVSNGIMNGRELAREIGCRVREPRKNTTLVSSFRDYSKTIKDVIFMEHGIGHTYGSEIIHQSYAGSLGKDRVMMFLNQHQHSLELNKKAYHETRQEIIGTPKMDQYEESCVKGRVVCFSFHWDCRVSPESGTAFYHFENELRNLILREDRDYEIVLHSHPKRLGKWQTFIARRFSGLDVRFISDFDEVLKTCDVYVCDNSSTMYEFALIGKPVIVLNSPSFRKGIDGGIRFWEYPCGLQVDDPQDLDSAILRTLDNPDEFKELRDVIKKDLYPYWHESCERTSELIVNYLDGKKV